jgi:sulfide:quinone oxidoreductase
LSLPQEGIELDVDRIVAMPRLIGPSIPGIPGAGPQGFVPIDVHCAVPGTGQRVFAAGDAVDFPVKHGGVGAQAADVAAAGIAREAGLKIPVPPFHPVVHGKLLTGAGPKFLFARHVGGQAFDSVISDQPTMGSSAQVTTLELARYLEHTTAPV